LRAVKILEILSSCQKTAAGKIAALEKKAAAASGE
jgi:hypothetical protein